ncbi:hypothetical protein [Rhizobium leucaenae]|nr:hypothetical protein [Rhizobium leucaenae]MBB6299747.1 folylpolyglutamate synthase/dihydropteroate synthase [Rhizobium leucaenae]
MASEAEPDAREALDRAAAMAAQNNGWVLVTGSLYLVGLLRSAVVEGG